jgi:hypothetical protein
VQVRDSLSASLLERKQVEKICIKNIHEEEYRSRATRGGGSHLGIRLITRPDQGRRACQPRSVLDQLRAVRSKYKCPGVGRRDTPAV